MRIFSDSADVAAGAAIVRAEDKPADGPLLASESGVLRVPLGETATDVFPLMVGAAEFGWNADFEESLRILDCYADYGGNAVHTADGYAGGRSDHIVGEWMRTRGTRDDVVLAARVGAHPDNPGLDSVNLVRGVEGALRRLGVERIDVLYLDDSSGRVSALEDTLATVEWLAESGKIGAIGAHGFSPERLVEARILSSAGYPRIEVLDEPYNILRRTPFEGDLRLVAGAQALAVTPSRALEHGFLAGRHRTKSEASSSVRSTQMRGHLNRRGLRVLRTLDGVSRELGVPVAAVAVAWLRAQRTIVAPIVSVFAASQIDELMQGAAITLSRAQSAELSRAAS